MDTSGTTTVGPGASAVDTIRRDSAEGRLTLLSSLREASPADSPRAPDPLRTIEESGAEDLKRMDGRVETYFFSELAMTRAYAAYLFRLAEKDLVGLVLETVREDSRIYPRPTPLDFFRASPFGLNPEQVEDILSRIRERGDCGDIRESRASNGARYLYSTLYLTVAHAEALTEWNEVGQAENP